MTAQQQQLWKLPIADIGAPAFRQTIRDNENIKAGRTTYYIPLDMVAIRDNFNPRMQMFGMTEEDWLKSEEIPELAEGLLATGTTPELFKGDFSEDGTKFYPSDGHRRYYAIQHLLKQGHLAWANGNAIDVIEVFPNPKKYTERDRLLQIYTTQHVKHLTPVQNMINVMRLKNEDPENPLSNDDVAKAMGQSRQWVDNMVAISEMDESTQANLANGTFSLNAALSVHRAKKKQQKEKEKPQQIDTNMSSQEITAMDPRKLTKEQVVEGMELTEPASTTPTEQPAKPVIVDTKSADQVELDSHKTDANFKETRPRSERDDALAPIDFKKEKQEGEMNLNEVIKLMDKLRTQISHLPKTMEQAKNDMEGLVVFCQKKLEETKEIIKKAADTR